MLLVPAEGCWTADFNAEDDMEIYVDVTTRPVLDGDTVTAVDLDLDVVRFFDGRVEVLDEDEFAEHQVQLAYPAELISQARATCDWLVGAVSSRAEPFGRAARPGWPGPAGEPDQRRPPTAAGWRPAVGRDRGGLAGSAGRSARLGRGERGEQRPAPSARARFTRVAGTQREDGCP